MGPARAVVLAAGGSERLGQPKSLVSLSVNGVEMPLVRWLVERIEAAGVETVVVTRQELVVDIMLALPGRAIVVNPNPESGRTGSLQCGIKAILDSKRTPKEFRLLVVPVDRPGFSDSTLSALLEADHCVCPAKDGRGGHPLLLTMEELGTILNAEPDVSLRYLAHPMRMNVVDEFLHLNIDSEDDMGRLVELVSKQS